VAISTLLLVVSKAIGANCNEMDEWVDKPVIEKSNNIVAEMTKENQFFPTEICDMLKIEHPYEVKIMKIGMYNRLYMLTTSTEKFVVKVIPSGGGG